MQLKGRDIDVAGGTLSLLTLGEGPAVVFLHGWALDQRMWRPQYALAKAGYQLITFDRRGFGASSAPPDLGRELDDISRVLDAMELDRVALVGMSQGGRVALRYALANPERLTHLVLQGAPIDGFPTLPPATEAVPVAMFRELLKDGRVSAFQDAWLNHDLLRYDRSVAPDVIAQLVTGYAGRDLLEGVPDSYALNVFEGLSDLHMPSLYVTGEHDTSWLKTVATSFASSVPNGHACFIPGAGHMCNVSVPKRYNSVLLDFLRS